MIYSLDNMRKLVNTPEWGEWVKMLHEHSAKLQDDLNRSVGKREYERASEIHAKMTDLEVQLRSFKARLEELKEKEKGGN